jgi:hypothetical protein
MGPLSRRVAFKNSTVSIRGFAGFGAGLGAVAAGALLGPAGAAGTGGFCKTEKKKEGVKSAQTCNMEHLLSYELPSSGGFLRAERERKCQIFAQATVFSLLRRDLRMAHHRDPQESEKGEKAPVRVYMRHEMSSWF